MLAAELVRLKVDVIVVATVPATLGVRQATSTIPIVISATELLEFQSQDCCDDPVGRGLIESLARPGSNVTGLATEAREISMTSASSCSKKRSRG
ncbi:MAG: ABC transporter substrate binding protein [Stellaceae bacterium]